MPPAFGGIWPALLTPLTDDGRPNFTALEALVDRFADQHLGGLYVAGSTGQWPLLTVEERRDIAACAVRAAAGRLPIMVHVGAHATADAVELARHADRIGADAVSAVGPTYYGFSADVVFEHYRRIGEASVLPLFAYYLSQVNQLTVGARDYAERLLALPHVAGMKITDRDLWTFGLLQAYTGGRLQLFSGADEVMCQAVLCGAVGAIGTFYNVWGPACQRARAACVAGDVAGAGAFMLRFQRAIAEAIGSGSMWTFLRSAMQLKYGIDVGMPRPPLGLREPPLPEAETRRILALVDEAE